MHLSLLRSEWCLRCSPVCASKNRSTMDLKEWGDAHLPNAYKLQNSACSACHGVLSRSWPPIATQHCFSSRIDTAFGVSWSLSALTGTPLHGPQSFSGWACASCSPSLCTLTSAVQHDQFAGTSSLRLSVWN